MASIKNPSELIFAATTFLVLHCWFVFKKNGFDNSKNENKTRVLKQKKLGKQSTDNGKISKRKKDVKKKKALRRAEKNRK